MTYCEEIGLKVGDKIKTLRAGWACSPGDVLTFETDDGGCMPIFRTETGATTAFGLLGPSNEGAEYGEGFGWVRLNAGGSVAPSYYPPTQNKPTHDPVNKPSHYMLFPEQGIEFIDVRDVLIERLKNFTPKQIDYWSRSFEYLARAGGKNGVEDIKKAKWYLDRLVATLEEPK